MRLHALTLEAFGPFPGREHIDFDALDQGILLVNGPTGSGKSSLLDAIAFALFGDVPGARRALRQSLRSHHAAPEAMPRVDLVFSVGPRRWRIERSPQWDAPKRRGTGTTNRPASVRLHQWREGQWHLVSARLDEAAEMVRDALGMDLDQFAQVVLLPQGEFAQFLRARPEERRALLERLFDVTRFDAVERWFAETRTERTRAVDLSLSAISARMGLVTDTLERLDDDEIPPIVWDVDSVDELPQTLRRLLGDVKGRDALAAQHAVELAGRATSAVRVVERAREDATRRAAFTSACDDEASWTPARLAQLKRSIDAAHQVAGVLRLAERARRTQDALDEARAARRRSQSHLLACLIHESEDDSADVLLERLPIEALSGAERSLRALAAILPSYRSRLADVISALQERGHASERANAAERDVEARRAEVERAQGAVVTARSVIEALPEPQEMLAALERITPELAAARRGAAELEASEGHHRTALAEYRQAEESVLTLRTARLAGIAGELAGRLEDGVPCPVCGAREHPQPAAPAGDDVDPADIAAAEERSRALDERRLTTNAAHAAAARALSDTHADLVASWSEVIALDAQVRQSLRDDAAIRRVESRSDDATAPRDGLGAPPDAASDIDPLELVQDPAPWQALHEWYRTLQRSQRDAASALDAAVTHSQAQEQKLARAQSTRDLTHEKAALAASALRVAVERAESAYATVLENTHEVTQALDDAPSARRPELAALTEAIAVTTLLGDVVSTGEDDEDRTSVSQGASAEAEGPADESLVDLAVMDDVARQVAQALDDLVRLMQRRDSYVRACAEERLASQAHDHAVADRDDELVAKGFNSVDEAMGQALDEEELRQIQERWQYGMEMRAAAAATLSDEPTLVSAFTPAADVARLQSRADIQARRSADATAVATRWRSAAETLERLRDEVADAVRRHMPLARAAHEVAELAATFSGTGENSHRMRLTSYVLAAHLETVTAMANERLGHMSDGRYQLRYTDERAKGNQRSGLGLLVVDAWTGRSRDTATLSGGEAFMASLALALGLGDAVRADSGGMELHTLFVDEGFGSLDQDTLEQVMEVLDGLREGGRLVGVVSHVTELRARIPTHIEVRKTSEGSTVQTTSPGRITASSPA